MARASGVATATADGCRVTGAATAVVGGAAADELLLLADHDGARELVAVPRDQPGVTVTALNVLDLTRPAAAIALDGATGVVVAEAGDAVVAAGLRRARVLLAAEQAGGARRCLDDAVAYAGLRHQFGRPIGSFQAVKHRLADMLVRVEQATSAAHYAAAAVAADDEADLWVAVAGAYCGEAFLRCATDAIQTFGGIGFTWEHHAHLYYRRARSDFGLLGTPRAHRRTLAMLLERPA